MELSSKIVELRQSGLGSTAISHRLGVAQSTVHYHLRKLAESRPRTTQQAGRRPGAALRTRQLVGSLLASGLSRAEVARRLGLAKSTVTYHARRLGEPIDARFARRLDWEAIQAYYNAGHSVRECGDLFGFGTGTWSQAVRHGRVRPRPRFRPLEEVFASGTRRQRGHLKARLRAAGLWDESCEICGIREWRGLPLSMALHHVNGDRYDNRLENLQLLCPNCHSQTDNFAGRAGRGGPEASVGEVNA